MLDLLNYARKNRLRVSRAFFSCSALSRFSHLTVLLFCLSICASAHAQTVSACYEEKCYPSLAEAEAVMRQDPLYGSLLRKSESDVISFDERAIVSLIRYRIDDREPERFYNPGYIMSGWGVQPSGCSPSESQDTACADEEFIMNYFINYFVNLHQGCDVRNQQITGSYVAPFRQVFSEYTGRTGNTGVLRSDFDDPWQGRQKAWSYEVNCPGWGQVEYDHRWYPVQKIQKFKCAEGFYAKDGIPPAYANANTSPTAIVHWPKLCWPAISYKEIRTTMTQVASCGTAHPCHPATGDKSRNEVDFNFAGRPFARNYHSLGQLNGRTGPGSNWSHTYEEHLDFYYSFPILFDQNGYAETFAKISETTFRGNNSPDRILQRENGDSFRLLESGGTEKKFDSTGRLIAIVQAGSASANATLTYVNDKLDRVFDVTGRSLKFHYENDRLAIIELPDGTGLNYAYDNDGNLISANYGNGEIKYYHYHENTLASPAQRNHLTGITSEDGRRYASFGYDKTGLVTSSVLLSGGDNVERTYLEYTSETSVTVTADGFDQRIFNIEPGLYRRVLGISSPSGNQIYQYTGDGRLASAIDPRGTKVEYGYTDRYRSSSRSAVGTNAEKQIKVVRNAENQIIRREVLSKESAVVQVQGFDYDNFRRLRASCLIDPNTASALSYVCGSASSPPQGVTQQLISYCTSADVSRGACPIEGLVASVTGGRLDKPSLSYTYYLTDDQACVATPHSCSYRKGDIKKTLDILGRATEYLTYDGAGRPLSIKDANGIVTDYTYHPRGWLTTTKVRGSDASSEADDRITRIDYWPTGLVKQVTQPDGAFTAFTYDAAHRLTDIADNAGNTVHYTLDNAGNRIKEDTTDASGALKRTLSRVYNQLGQLKTQASAVGDPTDFGYDANGNAIAVTDALATATQSEYDPLNRLSRTLQDVAGIKADTKFDYDALDNLTKVTDPKGLDTNYAYNGFGDLVKLISPDTGVTSYTYDSAGNRATQTDARGNTTAYGYDALNRLTKVTYPTSSLNVAYSYDVTQTACASGETFSIGRLAKMQDGGAITQYCYNRFGDLVRKVQTSNGKALVLRYDYTVGGQLRRMTYPDGAAVDYVRNTQGQTTEVGVTPAGGSRQVLLGNASYYPFGPAASWSYGNGRTLTRQYDLDYRPQAIQDTRPGGLEAGFGFDPAGNLTALTPAGNPTPEIGLGYDALGRLTGLKDGNTGTLIDGYSYDATGNRLSAKVGTATQAYSYPADSHRLSAVAGVARTYDATGNTTAIGGTARQYTYDTTGRMTQARRAGAVTMNYRYNGRGEQVRRFLGTTNTYTLYDEAGHWLGDYDNNGAPKQQAIWLDDLPVGLLANANKLHYIEPDHLGSPRVVIEPARDVAVWTWSLKGEAFGNTAPNQDPDGDGAALVLDMRFPGQRFDAASGLNQNYFRDYEAATGRYGQSDPIGLDGGSTTYSYTGSSPLMWKDTNGLVRWSGNAMPAAVGVGALSVGAYVFDLTSQCVNGRKAHVLVRAWGAGFGAGLKYLPVTSTAGNVTLEDQLPDIVPSNLVGLFFMENAGVSVGGFGGGCNAYQMGSEWTPAVSKNGTSCSLGGGGLDAGIGLQWGKSELVGLKWLKCDECSPVETPF